MTFSNLLDLERGTASTHVSLPLHHFCPRTYHTPSVTESVLSKVKCLVLFNPNSDGVVMLMNGGQVTLFKNANSVIMPGLNFK